MQFGIKKCATVKLQRRKVTDKDKDKLLTDKLLMKNCRRRHTNLIMVWIAYKKPYDMVPQHLLYQMRKWFNTLKTIDTNIWTFWRQTGSSMMKEDQEKIDKYQDLAI